MKALLNKSAYCRFPSLSLLAGIIVINTGMVLLLTPTLFYSSPVNLMTAHDALLHQRLEQSKSAYRKAQLKRSHVLKPLWKCSDPNTNILSSGRSPKVVFVHVFKTGGMTMRELLFRYARSCHAGIGIVSECSGVSASSIQATTGENIQWVNGFGTKHKKPCRVKAINRTKHDITLPDFHMEQSQLSHLDILAGHLSLGVGAAFSTTSSSSIQAKQQKQHDSVQYIAFFRNAIDKFISGIMYQKKDKHYSFEQILESIYKRVRGELKQNKYREGYSAYLLTPPQKEVFYGTNSTVQSRTQQILDNLQNENIVFGIVEQMSQSLELIHYVLDADKEQTPLFESFGMISPRTNTNNISEDASSGQLPAGKVNNPSKFSTALVVAELEKDPEFFAQLQEYVKFDALIYLQAQKLHDEQYQRLQQERIQGAIHLADKSR